MKMKYFSKPGQMKNLLIAIERSKFNYLYKYDHCFTSRKNIIGMSLEDLSMFFSQNPDLASETIEKALPLFEREDEVLLIEVDSTLISYELGFEFNAVQKIIPLNQMASDLFQSKLNANFTIEAPLPNALYEIVRLSREKRLRTKLAADYLQILQLDVPPEAVTERIFEAVSKKVSESVGGHETTTLDAILNLDTTPSGIPSGNIEGLMKIVCVGLLKVTGHTDQLRKSPLFQLLFENLPEINNQSLQGSYDIFESLINKNEPLVSKLRHTLKSDEFQGDVFKFCYYFFTAKKILLSSEGDIQNLIIEIEGDHISKLEFSQAMYLLGLTLSYPVLHESIQKLKYAPLFGVSKPPAPLSQYSAGDSVEFDPNTNESFINFWKKDKTYNKPAKTIDEGNPEPVNNPEGKKDDNAKSELGSLFDPSNDNPRLDLIAKAKKVAKGPAGKDAVKLLTDLYDTNKSFSFIDLEKKILQDDRLLKKDRKPKKAAQELLEVFKELQ